MDPKSHANAFWTSAPISTRRIAPRTGAAPEC
jgi:hypothetical protein